MTWLLTTSGMLFAAAVLGLLEPRSGQLRLKALFSSPSRTFPLISWIRRFLISQKSRRGSQIVDQSQSAITWDLLASGLLSGLPVPVAIRAAISEISDAGAQALRVTADLMSLGAGADTAWAPALAEPTTMTFARRAKTAIRSGVALAEVASALAEELRVTAIDLVEARAQRSAVLITGPLGLCFLPAFFCLGVVPVIIGLASRLLIYW